MKAATADLFVAEEAARPFVAPEIDSSVFGERSAMIGTWVEKLSSWLHMPYVYDRFGSNHQDRRAWRRLQQERFGPPFAAFYKQITQQNKFRAAVSSIPDMAIFIINQNLSEGSQEEQHLARQIESLWQLPEVFRDAEKSENLSVEDLKAATEQMEDRVFDVLNALAEYTGGYDLAQAAK